MPSAGLLSRRLPSGSESGKLVVQGKHAEDFAINYLDDPDEVFAQSNVAAHDRVTEPIIGTDESGKGDYFGPLVVAGVYLTAEAAMELKDKGIKDSKQISSDKRIGELADVIRTALDGLNERQRVAIVLNKFEDMNYADIADVMGLTTKAVKSLLSRARAKLPRSPGRDLLRQLLDGACRLRAASARRPAPTGSVCLPLPDPAL